jgi:hypothetical protein
MPTKTWTGANSNDWNDALSWDTLTVPVNGDDVIMTSTVIPNTNLCAIAPTGALTLASLDISDSGWDGYTDIGVNGINVTGNVNYAGGSPSNFGLTLGVIGGTLTLNGNVGGGGYLNYTSVAGLTDVQSGNSHQILSGNFHSIAVESGSSPSFSFGDFTGVLTVYGQLQNFVPNGTVSGASANIFAQIFGGALGGFDGVVNLYGYFQTGSLPNGTNVFGGAEIGSISNTLLNAKGNFTINSNYIVVPVATSSTAIGFVG